MSEQLGPHGLVVPFDPKPRVLPIEVVELYQWLIDRETPEFLKGDLEHEAEVKRRARLLIALHDEAIAGILTKARRTRVVLRTWRRWTRTWTRRRTGQPLR